MLAKLTGGLVNYYLCLVKHPQRKEQPAYQAECEDIIRALDMTFDEGCEFKAIWRTAAARLGNGKPNQKALYDAEKRVHYAQASLRQLQQAEEEQANNDGVVIHAWIESDGVPPKNPDLFVEVQLRDGTTSRGFVKSFYWPITQATSSILKFRHI